MILPAALAWARSGLMALSGRAQESPAGPGFDCMSGIESLISLVQRLSGFAGSPFLPDRRVLTERAALMPLSRQGRVSCNSSCRLIEANDGWIAVNLPRQCDRELLAAWIGCSVGQEPWQAISKAARRRNRQTLVEEGQLLGLAVAAVPGGATSPRGAPLPADHTYTRRPIGPPANAGRDWVKRPPLVIDLSALWAGPLCAHLLQRAGARVIKVESAPRPDNMRVSCPSFFDRINIGKQSVVLDFRDADHLARLRTLIGQADVVIGSARPRAFEQLGLAPESLVALSPGLTFVAVTAYGWTGPACNHVGFGDDAAAAGGLLVAAVDGSPMFAGDALADPLAGLAAAAGAFAALEAGGGMLVDVNLCGAAESIARGRALAVEERGIVTFEGGGWQVRVGRGSEAVAAPRCRPSMGRAASFGRDTGAILSEFSC